MKYFKRTLSLILALSIILIITGNAFAFEPKSEGFVADMSIENIKVKGIFDFSKEAFESVDSCIAVDTDGLYSIENEERLKSVLSEKEYDLVLKQIEITNNETLLAASNPLGTESNPYILTENVAFNTNATSASNTWFKISGIRGATDFIVNSSIPVTAVIYKKNLIGKVQIATASGRTINKVISASDVNNNSNSYLINVNASSSMTSQTIVRQHRDITSTYYSGGTVWTPNSYSAIPDINLITKKMWYLKAADIPILVDMISHDGYLKACEDYANGLLSIAGVVSTLALPVASGKIVGVALSLIGLSSPFNFRQQVLDQIDSAGGRSGNSYTKNVYMQQTFDANSAITFTHVYTWFGSTIVGAPGYTGAFRAP